MDIIFIDGTVYGVDSPIYFIITGYLFHRYLRRGGGCHR